MKPIWKPGLRLQSNNSSLSLPRGHLFCGGTLWLYNHKVLVAQQQSPWLFPPRNALHTKLSFLWTIKFGAEIKLKEEYCAIVEFTFLQTVCSAVHCHRWDWLEVELLFYNCFVLSRISMTGASTLFSKKHNLRWIWNEGRNIEWNSEIDGISKV